MLFVQGVIGFLIDGGMSMPAKGFQRLLHKFTRLRGGELPLLFMKCDQFATARREDITPGKNFRRPLAQRLIGDQLKAQERGKNAKRIARQRRVIDGAKRSGVNRCAGLRQIVIANGIHAHNGKHATQGRQFLRRTDADRAVAFNVQPRQLIGVGQLFVQRRVIFQYRQINVGYQLQ
ncbi:Uncharacterised protein [Klebsiella pneumoniae]|nr:Uncharacterised protein [Klebsiella pneumoniae]